MTTRQGQEHAEYGDRVPQPADPQPGASQASTSARAGQQQYSNITSQGASRFHAGNSYVEHQHNYWTPSTFQWPTDSEVQPFLEVHALWEALEFPEMNLRRANIEQEFPGTCAWLQNTEEHRRWRQPSYRSVHHGVLLIKGVPGSGKSTIMKHAYNESSSTISQNPVAFFFNARGHGLEKSLEGMFRALLCQLLAAASDLLELSDSVKRSEREYYKEHGWPCALLKDLFRKIVRCHTRRHSSRPLAIYIDALDECAEDEVREMLTYFKDLSEESNLEDMNLLVCFASRPYPNITFGHCETIELEKHPRHMDDIRKYAWSRLRADSLGVSESSNDHHELVSDIISRSSGVFLWVNLVVTRLKKSADHGDHPSLLRQHLLEIPKTLRDLFDAMIHRDGPGEFLLPLVQWVLFAQGRLRAIDIHTAVRFSAGLAPVTSAILRWEGTADGWLRNFILTSSKGFLKTTDGDSAYIPCEFVHECAREYFLDGGLQKLDPSLGSNFIAKSHSRLALTCQKYFDLSGKIWCAVPRLGRQGTGDILDAAPLLAYIRDKAAFLHAEAADRSGISQASFCVNFAFDTWLELALHYPRPEPTKPVSSQVERAKAMRDHATPLHVLVDNQMESLVQRELQRQLQRYVADNALEFDNYINAQCGGLGTALHLAVERNNTSIIRALVSSGAHIDFRCENLGTPVDYAILLERTESVEVLLQLGAMTASGLSRHQRRKLLDIKGSRGPSREEWTYSGA